VQYTRGAGFDNIIVNLMLPISTLRNLEEENGCVGTTPPAVRKNILVSAVVRSLFSPADNKSPSTPYEALGRNSIFCPVMTATRVR
jgi:hypothetical protein